jgi:DNA repair protein RadC
MKDKSINIPINKWSENDRPREKLLNKGVSALSDAELIAILIGSGNRQESAVDLSKRILLSSKNNLDLLGTFSIEQLTEFKGIGQAKAISIVAALEIGRRRNVSKALEVKSIKSSKDAFNILSPVLSDKTKEEFWVVYLKKNVVSGMALISSGGLDASMVDIRVLMKKLLEKEATSFVVAHNHPSGNKQPSESDKQLTKKIFDAANMLNIRLLDHIIVAKQSYFSFVDNGIL